MAITFTVNGAERTLDVDERMPLLWALRDVLSLTGTKYGCGMNRCGACTVHVDGEARRACVTRVGQVAGRKVVTIEGLSPDGTHPLQRAWIEHNVPQCGYCQAGQIMSAAALLQENAQPSDDDIDGALRVNLCRCGTYQRVRQAVHTAADELRRGGVSSAAGGGVR
jgi:aerobic-type carbon monoxide dehydrogenase small subunit (CoxS/CutS family)